MTNRIARPEGYIGGMNQKLGPGNLLTSLLPQPANQTPVSADSNQTLTASQILAGLLVRTGMTAGRTDTTPTAALIDTALTPVGWTVPDLGVGESFELRVSNQVAFAETFAGGTGVTIQSTKTTCPASGSVTLIFTKTGVATYDLFIL